MAPQCIQRVTSEQYHLPTGLAGEGGLEISSHAYLNIGEVEKDFAVFTVEASLGALPLGMALLSVQPDHALTCRAGDQHERAAPFMAGLW